MRAKDVMHAGTATIGEQETRTAAAKYMRDMEVVTLPVVGAAASVEHRLAVMAEHRIRRLRVVDQHHLLANISEADIARHLPEDEIAQSVNTICAPICAP